MARVLLALPAAVLFLGGGMHLSAFKKALAAVAGSNLPPFFGNALKALWVMDSCGMFVIAAVCVALAVRPESASPLIVALVSLIPLSTALLLYLFIGNFFAAHMLLAASLSIVAAAAAM